MIITLLPHAQFSNESYSTLAFGQRCRSTELSPYGRDIGNSLFERVNRLMLAIENESDIKDYGKGLDLIDVVDELENNQKLNTSSDGI